MGAPNLNKIQFHGDSMKPSLKSGDLIHVDFSENVDPQLGDILLMKQKGEWVVHRMVGDSTVQFTKGDFAPARDNDGLGSPMGTITGFTRQNRSYEWGLVGQPFKRLLAFLSSHNEVEEARTTSSRIKRRVILRLMNVLQVLINIKLLFSK